MRLTWPTYPFSRGADEGSERRTVPGALAAEKPVQLVKPAWREPLVLLSGGTAATGLVLLALHLGHYQRPASLLIQVAALAFALLVLASLVALHRYVTRARILETAATMLGQVDDARPDPHVVVNPAGDAVLMNRAFAELLDPEQEGLGALPKLRQWLARTPEARARLEDLERAAAAGERTEAEVERADDGPASAWYEVAAFPLPGLPGHVGWTVTDVTAKRQMLDVIRDEQRKLSDFLEQAPLGFYSVNEAGQFLLVNATLARWLGFEPGDLVGSRWRLHDFLLEPAPPGVQPYIPFAREDEPGRGEVVLRGAGGRPFHAFVVQTVAADPDSGAVRTRSVVRDLRPEREWEHALRVSEQRFQRFFEEAPVGVALLDQEHAITETNPAFAALLDRDRESLSGTRFTDLVRASSREEIATRLDQVIAGNPVPLPIEMPLAGDAERSFGLFARPLDGGDGTTGLMLHLIDTSQQKRLEVQFAQSQKMLAVGQLAGGIAHDFNNLLTAMIGFCDLLLLRHQPGDHSFADIMQIKQNANRAANLVRQLLAFSRQQTLQPRVLNLTDVLAELSNLLRRLIGATIELKVQHGRDLGLVRVDQVQLEQVIMNLAVNGRDAMPGSGTLTIRTSNVAFDTDRPMGRETISAGEYVLIEVSDTGIGIPRENLDRIFEPFFSTKEVGSGTGLGLSTVYGIVKQTGGYVTVDSAPGQGARFGIYLPRYRGQVTESGARGEGAGASADLTGKGTVLIVEDEDPVRLFSARALRNKGYKVLEARSGDVALQVLESAGEPVDIVVTDVVMPKMDGPTLIGKLRERWPDLRIICISGYAEGAFRQKLDSFSDIHFLAKPFSLQQLAGKVKEVLAADG